MRIDAGRVFGASERLQPVTEAPASVSFITAEDIARYGYRTLADILRGVRGMYVTDDRNFSYLGVRGFRQAGRLQQPHPAAGQRTPRQRQRIRTGGDRRGVRHRPGDVRAGRNHPRARLVTLRRQRVLRGRERDHADRRLARRRLDRGRGRHARDRAGAASVGRRLANGVDFALSGTYEQSDGVERLYFPAFDTPATNNGVADGLDGEHFGQFYGHLSFKDLTFTGAYGARQRTCRRPRSARCSTSRFRRSRRPIGTRCLMRTTRARSARRIVVVRASFDRFSANGIYPFAGDTSDAPPLIGRTDVLGSAVERRDAADAGAARTADC